MCGCLAVDLQGKALLDMQDYLSVEMRLTYDDTHWNILRNAKYAAQNLREIS
jgi:hypothetical protein